MSSDELTQIIDRGFAAVGMTIQENAKNMIATLSQGLPFYTHSLSLQSGMIAVDDERLDINRRDVIEATAKIIDKSFSIKSAYHKATVSQQKHLYCEVLLACALSYTDEFGFFSPSSTCYPLSAILKRSVKIASFMHHIKEFCSEQRGHILEKRGTPHRTRYRFSDPLMQPYVVLEGISKGRLGEDDILERVHTYGMLDPDEDDKIIN